MPVPNLFLVAQKICQPHTWFRSSKQTPSPLDRTEIWQEPVSGLYKHSLAGGWYLVATKDLQNELRYLPEPKKVVYSPILHRWVLHEEVMRRCRQGFLKERPNEKTSLIFFKLDDGRTWIQCFAADGSLIPGPWQRFVLDDEKRRVFRIMLKGDDPNRRPRSIANSGHAMSAVSSLHASSGVSTPLPSPGNSVDFPESHTVNGDAHASLVVPTVRPSSTRHPSSKSLSASLSPLATPLEETEVGRTDMKTSHGPVASELEG